MFTIVREPDRPDTIRSIKDAQDAFVLFDIIHAMFIDVDVYDKWMADLIEDMTIFGRECTLRYHLAREQSYARKVLFTLRNRTHAIIEDSSLQTHLMRLAEREAIAHCDAYTISCHGRIIDGQNSRMKILVAVAQMRLQDKLTFKK